MALLEALVATFPEMVKSVGVTPRLLVEAREGLAAATEDGARLSALAALGVQQPKELLELRDFLMAHRSVSLTADDVRTILSLRDDPDWRGIDNADELRRTLRTGSADGFAAALADRDADQRRLALGRAVELVRDECRRWVTGAINGLNAAVPALDQDAATAGLRVAGRDLLDRVTPQEIRGLSLDTVRFLFADPTPDSSLLKAADAATSSLTPVEGEEYDVRALVELLMLVSPVLSGNRLDFARKALSERSDADLEPLYEPGDHVPFLLDGDLFRREWAKVAKWPVEPTWTPDQLELPLERVLFAKSHDIGYEPAAGDELAQDLAPKVTGLSADWKRCFTLLKELLKDAPPSANIGALATEFARWPGDLARGLLWALQLPVPAAVRDAIEMDAGRWIQDTTIEWPDVAALARAARPLLTTPSRTSTEFLIKRWHATADQSVAALAARSGDEAVLALVASLEQTPAPAASTWTSLVGQLRAVILKRGSHVGATALVAHISSKAALPPEYIPHTIASAVAMLPLNPDYEPVVRMLESRLQSADTATLPSFAAAALALSEARLDGEGKLAHALAVRSKELPWIDWGTARWLALRLRNGTVFRDALVAVIADPSIPLQKAMPHLESVRGAVRSDSQVKEAAMIRLAGETCEDVEDVLGQMRDWHWPKKGSEDYHDAKRKIGLTCPGVLDRVGG